MGLEWDDTGTGEEAIARSLITKQGLRGLKVEDPHETDLVKETGLSRSAIYRALKRGTDEGLSLPLDLGGFPGEKVHVVSVEGRYFVRDPPSTFDLAYRRAIQAVMKAIGQPILPRMDDGAEGSDWAD